MTKRIREINPGGINGTGKGIVNVNSKDFKGLRKAIEEHAKNQTAEERFKYELLSLRFQMENYISEDEPTVIVGVGEFLKKHLKAIKIKNNEFAKYIDLEESNLSSIIKGRRKINIDLAFKLGQIFGLNPNLWLLLQSKNELLGLDEARILEYKKYALKDLLKKVG